MTLPEWQLEPDEEAYFGSMDEGNIGDGAVTPTEPDPMDQSSENRIESPDTNPTAPKLDQRWIDEALGRERETAPRDRRDIQQSRPNQ